MSYYQQNVGGEVGHSTMSTGPGGLYHHSAKPNSYAAQHSNQLQQSKSANALLPRQRSVPRRGGNKEAYIPNYARPVGYKKEKKRKPSYSNVMQHEMTLGVMIPNLRNALAELNHVLYAIKEFEFELLSKKQQGRFGDMLSSDARGWIKTVEAFEATAKQLQDMQQKIREEASRQNMHPDNLQNSHWVCPSKGMSSKRYLMLFANGKYHLAEGVEHDPYEAPWYERSIGTWTYYEEKTTRGGYRGALQLREERHTDRMDIRVLGSGFDLWKMRLHGLRMPVSRDWQRLGGAYQTDYDDADAETVNSGSWKRVNKPFNAAKVIYVRSFGDNNCNALRTIGFDVPIGEYTRSW